MYVDPVDASHVLAKAAAAVVYAPDTGSLDGSLERLKEALQYYELCRLVSPVSGYRPVRRCGAAHQGHDVGAGASNRFRAALTTVDWRAQSPAGLADLLITIAGEVADLHEIPGADSAVQLVAIKVAAVCGIAIDDDEMNALIHACLSHAKQLEAQSSPTA